MHVPTFEIILQSHPVIGWVLSHHIVSFAVGLLTLLFVGFVLGQQRPTGSAIAWLLAILFVPYLGMPLYLILGGRKFRRRRRAKAPLTLPGLGDETRVGPFGLRKMGTATSIAAAEWLTDGVQAYQCFLDQILSAKKSIRIVSFLVGDDETGRTLLDALSRRAREGVAVHLLVDDLLRTRAPGAELARLRSAGGKVSRFMPLLHVPFRGQANLRNHRKIAVFDGQRAIIGGMNLADAYMGPAPSEARWRDLAILLTGEAAGALDAIFRADWEFASGETLSAPAVTGLPVGPAKPIWVVPSGPDSPSDPLYDALLTGVFRSERRFWIATPYFIPDESLVKALVLAIRRGVDVRILVPAASNHKVADFVAAPSLRQLERDGATVHRLGRMLHAKAILVDDALAVVGSANFDMRSLFLDYEIAVFFPDPRQVEQLARWFAESLQLAAVEPPPAGWLRSRVEGIIRLVAPLL